jgi:hypothetical protein
MNSEHMSYFQMIFSNHTSRKHQIPMDYFTGRNLLLRESLIVHMSCLQVRSGMRWPGGSGATLPDTGPPAGRQAPAISRRLRVKN